MCMLIMTQMLALGHTWRPANILQKEVALYIMDDVSACKLISYSKTFILKNKCVACQNTCCAQRCLRDLHGPFMSWDLIVGCHMIPVP